MHGNGSRLSAADQTRLAGSHSYASVMLEARAHTRAYFTKSAQSKPPLHVTSPPIATASHPITQSRTDTVISPLRSLQCDASHHCDVGAQSLLLVSSPWYK